MGSLYRHVNQTFHVEHVCDQTHVDIQDKAMSPICEEFGVRLLTRNLDICNSQEC